MIKQFQKTSTIKKNNDILIKLPQIKHTDIEWVYLLEGKVGMLYLTEMAIILINLKHTY